MFFNFKKFSSLNTIFEIYTDNVNFPIDFSDDVAKDLIQKVNKIIFKKTLA